MNWEAWFAVSVVVLLLVALARNWGSPDLLVVGCLVLILVVGQLTGTDKLPDAKTAIAGFANPAVLTVGALFIVVAGLVQLLESSGQLGNTYILFSNDNGYHMGQHRLPPDQGQA